MPISSKALDVFLKNFERLRSLSFRSSSHEIGEAVGIVRKLIWNDDNLNKIRTSIGDILAIVGSRSKVSTRTALLRRRWPSSKF